MISPAKLYSILGNPKSLAPLGVKDSANCLGLTTASYITGKKEEAQDRFIDEAGTEVIWLGAIPAFKWGIDKTLFKVSGYDPKYDIRNLDNKDIFEKTKKYAPTEKIAKNIEKIGQNAKTYRALNFVKVAAATVLALVSYDVLTNKKQKYTDKKVEQRIRAQMQQNEKNNQNVIDKKINKTAFSALKKHNNNLSFKGGLTDFVLDPVKNMYVLDGGITGQRLIKSRDPQEFMGYVIKEGGFLVFMYCLGQKIQDYMINRADKKHNKSIALDSRVLEDDKFKNLFKTGEIEQSLKEFPKYELNDNKPKGFINSIKNFFNPPKPTAEMMAKDAELYEYIHNNPDNAVVKAAKKSDIIENYKVKQNGILGFFKKRIDTGKIDTRKYVDMNSLKETHSNISKLYNQFKNSGEDIDTFFKGVRKLKRNAIKTNMFSSMIALGVILPGLMLAKRVLSNDTEFATTKRIREKLENEKKLHVQK